MKVMKARGEDFAFLMFFVLYAALIVASRFVCEAVL